MSLQLRHHIDDNIVLALKPRSDHTLRDTCGRVMSQSVCVADALRRSRPARVTNTRFDTSTRVSRTLSGAMEA
jgi:hypothetical protein